MKKRGQPGDRVGLVPTGRFARFLTETAFLELLARWYPQSRFTGIDLSAEAIEYARARTADLANVEYLARHLSDFDRWAPPDAYDFIATFDAIHDQGQPLEVLKGIRRALAPEGVHLMQDISGTGRWTDAPARDPGRAKRSS